MMIQSRIVKVFGGGRRFGCINVAAILRVSVVIVVCLCGFLLRAVDEVFPPKVRLSAQDHNPTTTIYLWILAGCQDRITRSWYLSPCFLRWVAELLPVFALLYIMRITDVGSKEEGHLMAAAAAQGNQPRRRLADGGAGSSGDFLYSEEDLYEGSPTSIHKSYNTGGAREGEEKRRGPTALVV